MLLFISRLMVSQYIVTDLYIRANIYKYTECLISIYLSFTVNTLFNGSSLYISVFVAEKHSTLKSSVVATNLFNEYLKENKVGYYISMHDDEIEIRTELPRNIFGGKIRHLYRIISTTSTFNIFRITHRHLEA